MVAFGGRRFMCLLLEWEFLSLENSAERLGGLLGGDGLA